MDTLIQERLASSIFSDGEKLSEAELQSLTEADYEELLQAVIPFLDMLPKTKIKMGDEGIVYFLDDHFVVKKYHDSIYSIYNPYVGPNVRAFDKYFEEIQKFNEMDLSINKYYAHATVTSGNDRGLYILQERVKGKTLFEDKKPDMIYRLFKKKCSKAEFDAAISDGCGELYEAIVAAYLNGFYKTNLALAGVSDEVLENFILTSKEILTEGRFVQLDTHAANVMFDKKNLTHIDPAFLHKAKQREDEFNKILVMRDMMYLFENNIYAYNLINSNSLLSAKPEIESFVHENKRNTAKALKKYVSATNDLVKPVFTSEREKDYKTCEDAISPVVSEKDKEEIIGMLQRG